MNQRPDTMPADAAITIVSGLPRSGTSLMMQMLAAGGLPPLTDNLRAADADNPVGYYEYERIKRLKDDPACLDGARGCVVKVISELLLHLPAHHRYRVVFLRRHMHEILASQRQMLVRRGKPADPSSDAKMAQLFEKHLQRVEGWLSQQPHIATLFISYNDLLASPAEPIAQINDFLGRRLDTERMAQAIDQQLYRQRRPSP